MKSRKWQIGLILAAIIFITLLHFLTPTDRLLLHQIYQRLYYLPIIAAAVLFGWRGGLFAAVLASISYLPHIILHWHHLEYNYALNQYAEIGLFYFVGVIIGLLGDANRRERDRVEQINLELQTAYTDLKQTVAQLLQAERLSSLGEIAAGVVHEIRNPLGAIKGAVEIIEDELAKDSPRREFAEIAKQEVERINKLVGEFLNYARPAKPTKTPCNVNEIIRSVRLLFEQQAKNQNVRMIEEFAENIPLISLDAEQIKQVLVNLTINALQAMPDHGTLTFRALQDANIVKIEVEDTGEGINEVQIAQIFDPFFTTKAKGVGLGLAIAYRIITQHDAKISARNSKNGAVFMICFDLLN